MNRHPNMQLELFKRNAGPVITAAQAKADTAQLLARMENSRAMVKPALNPGLLAAVDYTQPNPLQQFRDALDQAQRDQRLNCRLSPAAAGGSRSDSALATLFTSANSDAKSFFKVFRTDGILQILGQHKNTLLCVMAPDPDDMNDRHGSPTSIQRLNVFEYDAVITNENLVMIATDSIVHCWCMNMLVLGDRRPVSPNQPPDFLCRLMTGFIKTLRERAGYWCRDLMGFQQFICEAMIQATEYMYFGMLTWKTDDVPMNLAANVYSIIFKAMMEESCDNQVNMVATNAEKSLDYLRMTVHATAAGVAASLREKQEAKDRAEMTALSALFKCQQITDEAQTRAFVPAEIAHQLTTLLPPEGEAAPPIFLDQLTAASVSPPQLTVQPQDMYFAQQEQLQRELEMRQRALEARRARLQQEEEELVQKEADNHFMRQAQARRMIEDQQLAQAVNEGTVPVATTSSALNTLPAIRPIIPPVAMDTLMLEGTGASKPVTVLSARGSGIQKTPRPERSSANRPAKIELKNVEVRKIDEGETPQARLAYLQQHLTEIEAYGLQLQTQDYDLKAYCEHLQSENVKHQGTSEGNEMSQKIIETLGLIDSNCNDITNFLTIRANTLAEIELLKNA